MIVVPRLVKDVVPVIPHALATEHGREPPALRHLLLRDALIPRVVVHRLNLQRLVLGLRDDKLGHLQLRVGDGAAADARVASALEALVEDVLAPPVPVGRVDVVHAGCAADVGVVVAL